MAIYTMNTDFADRRAKGLQRARSIRVWVLVAVVVVAACLIYARMRWGLSEHLFAPMFIAVLVTTIQFLRPNSWKKPAEAAMASVQVQSLEIDSDHVRSDNGAWSRSLRRDEIVRAEEPHRGLGLYLRTSNPFRWLLIPKSIEGYEEIKSGLAANAIPVSRTRFSPHWIDSLALVIFFASMITLLIASNRDVLLVNLAVDIFVATAGLFIAHARADNRKLKLQYGLFYCLPLVFAIVLWPMSH